MQKIKSIIKRIWQEDITAKENKINISGHFKPQERRSKDMLKKEFDLHLRSGKPILSPGKSKQLLEKLHVAITSSTLVHQSKSRTATLLPPIWTRWAAAALVLLVAGSIWHHIHVAGKSPVASSTGRIKENALTVQSNNGVGIRRFILPDKSVIQLSQGSSVSYYASFDTGSRNISLSGKAIFEVVKDIARPFTVYAADLSTTALGTKFMMSTLPANKVQVKLFEGKVVIRSTARTFIMKEIYLNAGQQFILDKKSGQVNVSQFEDSNYIPANKAIISARNTNSAVLEFNQEPLENVLESIGKKYNVQFTFKDSGFDSILVTGKLLPSDSLQMVLSMLGNINGLSFKELNNKIEVARLQ